MLPARLALCDLEAPGWGEPRFPHCSLVASYLKDCCMAFSLFVVRSCFILPYQYQGWYYVIISSDTFQMTMNWPADHRPCRFCFVSCFVLFCLCGFCFCFCFVFFSLFCVGWMSLHGESSMDYVSILIQFLFWCTLSIRWCCHCINSLNLQICNWLSGLLNDLVRAIWRWTEKKSLDSRRIPAWRLRN